MDKQEKEEARKVYRKFKVSLCYFFTTVTGFVVNRIKSSKRKSDL
jgi:hypothetical protein